MIGVQEKGALHVITNIFVFLYLLYAFPDYTTSRLAQVATSTLSASLQVRGPSTSAKSTPPRFPKLKHNV